MQLPSFLAYKYVNLNGRFVLLETFKHFPFEKSQAPTTAQIRSCFLTKTFQIMAPVRWGKWNLFLFSFSSFKTLYPLLKYSIKIKGIWQIWKLQLLQTLNGSLPECLQNRWHGVCNSQNLGVAWLDWVGNFCLRGQEWALYSALTSVCSFLLPFG